MVGDKASQTPARPPTPVPSHKGSLLPPTSHCRSPLSALCKGTRVSHSRRDEMKDMNILSPLPSCQNL